MPRPKTVHEQIRELQQKITLIEGDRSAYAQASQYKIEKNNQKIAALRKENKELHQRFASAINCDEETINETFGDHKDEKPSFRNKSTEDAIKVMNNKMCDAKKRLSRQEYLTREKKQKLEEAELRMKELEDDQRAAKENEEGETDISRRKRELENSLKKTEMKTQEAQNICATYQKILAQFNEEKLDYPKRFDDIKIEIERNKEELKKLKEMQVDAETSRDAAKTQLVKQEEKLRKERKEREDKLKELRKQAEEKKQIMDKTDRRLQSRSAVNPQDQESSTSGDKSGQTEETEKKILTYQEAFLKIKEATGVSDVADVVERFRNQDDTYHNLEEQKKNNNETLESLQNEVVKAHEDYTAMKYTGETKLSHGERTLEESNNFLQEEEQRKEGVEQRLKETNGVLVNVRSGVENLSIKLAYLKGTKSQEPKQTPSADQEDYMLDLLMDIEDKLQKLIQDLGENKKYEDVEKEILDSGYTQVFEDTLPQYNTRVQIPSTNKELGYDDVDSGEDEECLTREQLKKRSDDLVNSKTKRRPQKKKKTKGK